MEAITIEDFIKKFKKKKEAAEYLGVDYHQLKRAEKMNGVVVERKIYIPSAVKVRPIQTRLVRDFTGPAQPLGNDRSEF